MKTYYFTNIYVSVLGYKYKYGVEYKFRIYLEKFSFLSYMFVPITSARIIHNMIISMNVPILTDGILD